MHARTPRTTTALHRPGAEDRERRGHRTGVPPQGLVDASCTVPSQGVRVELCSRPFHSNAPSPGHSASQEGKELSRVVSIHLYTTSTPPTAHTTMWCSSESKGEGGRAGGLEAPTGLGYDDGGGD